MLETLFKHLKIFFYKSIDTKEHSDLLYIFTYNRVHNVENLIIVCNSIADYYASKTNIYGYIPSSADKVFLMMIQEILEFIIKRTTSKKESLIPDIDRYLYLMDNFKEKCIQPCLNVSSDTYVLNVLNRLLKDTKSYFYGDIVLHAAGALESSDRVDIIIFDADREKLENEMLILTKNDEYKFNYAHYSGSNKSYKLDINGKIIYLNLRNSSDDIAKIYDFTFETILIDVFTFEIKDDLFNLVDIYEQLLKPVKDYWSTFGTYHYAGNRYDAMFKMNKKVVLKYFKYAKNFKSKKKVQRFMREAFLRKYDQFTRVEMFNLTEYLLLKGI